MEVTLEADRLDVCHEYIMSVSNLVFISFMFSVVLSSLVALRFRVLVQGRFVENFAWILVAFQQLCFLSHVRELDLGLHKEVSRLEDIVTGFRSAWSEKK